jgi:sulfite exporter TauE/SafE/copper chaperone CopZ
MDQHLKKIRLKIHGMHCASCEVLIENKFKEIPGVQNVKTNYVSGKAKVYCSRSPSLDEFQKMIAEYGYTVSLSGVSTAVEISCAPNLRNTPRDYAEIGAMFLVVTALYSILKQFNIIPAIGISENMGYGVAFLIGLVAATSTCIAVTGGLLIAVAAKYNERNPTLTGAQKFKPHMAFNIGRIVSYTVLGGATGALGSLFTISPATNGVLTIAVSMIMIILGFQLLRLFPWMSRFMPRMPKFLANKVNDAKNTEKPYGPFLLGSATFFLPCGFTQALQLYVLSRGDIATGALTMFFFSLGTLPALMALGAISSFAKGNFQRYFLKFAGATVILLGFFNMNNGFSLLGKDITLASVFQTAPTETSESALDPNVELVNGKQIVKMKVSGLDYFPHRFTVLQGVPVEWQIDGGEALGCAQVLTMPTLGIAEYLNSNSITTINFTPSETGKIPFSCSMGMTTRGSSFTVIPNTAISSSSKSSCNPQFANCL